MCRVWHSGVPFDETWNTCLKKLSCTVCILVMWSSVRPIQLSQFESIFDATFISYCSTAACAILWPMVAGWLIASIMASPASIAPDILPSKVAAILASHPSSCIWSPSYFSDLEFSMTAVPIILHLLAFL